VAVTQTQMAGQSRPRVYAEARGHQRQFDKLLSSKSSSVLEDPISVWHNAKVTFNSCISCVGNSIFRSCAFEITFSSLFEILYFLFFFFFCVDIYSFGLMHIN